MITKVTVQFDDGLDPVDFFRAPDPVAPPCRSFAVGDLVQAMRSIASGPPVNSVGVVRSVVSHGGYTTVLVYWGYQWPPSYVSPTYLKAL